MPRRSLTLLGSFQAALDGQPVSAFESDKVRALLAFLAVESDRPHSREKLAGLLWPDSSEAAARASLSHALSSLRAALPDRPGDPPFLLASRQTVQLNRDADLQVDAIEFSDLSVLGGLEQAVALYRGRFLEGFSLPGCPEFEEWLLLEQEHLHRCAMDALARLADAYEAQGQFDRALPFAWRQLALDPWWESAHRQAMRLLARSGQREAALAQFHTCRRLLKEELGVEPSPETTHLYDQIRHGALPIAPEPLRPAREVMPSPLPGYVAGREACVTRPVFVAREPELAWLQDRLDAALAGRGQAAFVVGGPGRGKTVLLHEFARRALDAHPTLLLAMGACNAYAGVGDPYLPFRGVLAMLTGDAEAQWAAGCLSAAQARRTWDALPNVAPLLVRRGSGLVGTLLPARDLLARAQAHPSAGAGWLLPLQRLCDPSSNPAGGLEQSHLLEQFTNLLLDLSESHPLLLVLDDLHWADLASLALLLHLARRVDRGRILLTAAYRPHELALGRDGQRHPLEPVLADFRTRFGDAWLDLAAADDVDGRTFVDRLLDTEPNALDEPFRAALHARTRGHPLFTVELLRAMQARGDLVRDHAGRWVPGDRLEWDRLPARTEAAIAERVDRLPRHLRDLLAVASVEGEEFTAQAVAHVQGLDELQALRLLRGQLAARHRLVRERGEVRLDGRSLSRYRFSHFLVQQYLYHGLGEGERRLLHRRVGEALEELYRGRLEEAAVQLTRHFAGDPERERRYARMAGERAAEQFANDEALHYLSRALELAPEGDVSTRCELLLLREKVCARLRLDEMQRQDLDQLQGFVGELGIEQKAEVALRRAYHVSLYGDAGDTTAAKQAIELAQTAGRADLELWARDRLARALSAQGQTAAGRVEWEAAWAVAQDSGRLDLTAAGQSMLASSCIVVGEWSAARVHLEEALRLWRRLGDPANESLALSNLGMCCIDLGDYGAALTYLHEALSRATALGEVRYVGDALANLALLFYTLGCYGQARDYAERGFHVDLRNSPWLLVYRSHISRCLGDYRAARSHGDEALRLSRVLRWANYELLALQALGHLHQELGQQAQAHECYAQGLRLCRQSAWYSGWVTGPLAGLASAALEQDDVAGAQEYAMQILAMLDGGVRLPSEIQRSWVYLTCYQALRAAEHPRALEVISTAHERLLQEGGSIPDEALRHSFVENVRENRDIVREWRHAHPEDEA